MAYGDSQRARGPLLAGVGLLSLVLAGGAQAGKEEDAMRERIAKLERTLSSSALLDMAKQLEALQQEVRQLRGDLENQGHTVEQLRKGQREAYMDADRRLSALEQGHGGAAGGAVEPPLPTADAPPTDTGIAGKPSDQSFVVNPEQTPTSPNAAAEPGMEPGVASPGVAPNRVATVVAPAAAAAPAATANVARSDTPESEAAYKEAFAVLKAGQYDQSIKAFGLYLQKYPQSQYADNAQYWIGESHYVLRQYEPAIAQYQKVISGFPDSPKASQAMLKIGYAYDKLGKTEAAASTLIQLKQKFPGSAAARLADEQLARMKVTPKAP